jgi:DNA polymerase V
MDAVLKLYDRIVNPMLLVRRITLVANKIVPEVKQEEALYEQLDLFTDYESREKDRAAKQKELEKEQSIQRAVLEIQKKYGKNALLKGMNLEEGATAKQRNGQIGGHKA